MKLEIYDYTYQRLVERVRLKLDKEPDVADITRELNKIISDYIDEQDR